MRKVIVLMALMLLPALSGPVNADLMAIWDFGPNQAGYTQDVTAENVVGTPELSLSGGDYDTDGKDGVVYTDAAGTWHSVGQAGAWGNVTADSQWIMMINTTGWEDMTIRWDYRSENTVGDLGDLGPESFDFDYRVGGSVDWTEILNNQSITRDYNWHEFSYDLSAISAIENQPLVQFRVDDLNQGDESGGNFMFDNLELTGVPEPCSVALLGIGALMALTRKRRLV